MMVVIEIALSTYTLDGLYDNAAAINASICHTFGFVA